MPSKYIKNILKGLIFLFFGLVLLYLVYNQINKSYLSQCALDGIPAESCNLISKIISDFKSTNLLLLFVVLVLYMLSNVSRALRWKQLLQPLGYEVTFFNSFATIMVGYFANLGVPRFGEFVRPALLSRYEKIALDKVLGTVVVGRLMDFVMLGVFMSLALVVSFNILYAMLSELGLGEMLYNKINALVSLIILLLLTSFLIFFFRKSKIINNYSSRVKSLLSGFKDGLTSIAKLDKPLIFIGHSFFIWIMYWLMTVVGFQAFGPTSGLFVEPALLVFIMGALGMIFPSPGGMGSYHFLMALGLSFYGVVEFDGFSYAMIMFFLIHLFGNTLVGLLSLIILPFYNREAGL